MRIVAVSYAEAANTDTLRVEFDRAVRCEGCSSPAGGEPPKGDTAHFKFDACTHEVLQFGFGYRNVWA